MVKYCFIQENFFAYTSEKINIFKHTICQYKKETYLNLKNYDDRVAVTKLRLSSHKLVVVTTAKWYKLPDDQRIRRYWYEMHVLFDCDNYNALRQYKIKKKRQLIILYKALAINYKNLKFSPVRKIFEISQYIW